MTSFKFKAGALNIDPDTSTENQICSKIMWRLIPFMLLLYVVNQLDRVNISFASLAMNSDLSFTPAIYGFAAGIFFMGYFVFEIPSNIIMSKVGARRWMARIMFTWGAVTISMMFVRSPTSFYVVRFLLGLAEAGFLPGMILYITYWVPRKYRGRAYAWFILAVPLTPIIAGPITTIILGMNGLGGLRGWQWIFVLTGIPAVILSVVTLLYLTDKPEGAKWLTEYERSWLIAELAKEESTTDRSGHHSLASGFSSPTVLLLAATYFAYVVGFYGISFWLPQMIKGMGFSNFSVGFVIAVPYALAAIGSVVWSRRSDRLSERRIHFALPCFVATAGFAVSAFLGAQVPALVSLTVALIGILCAMPVFWSIPGNYITGAAAASGIAVINSVGNLGGLFGPYFVGWLKGTTGNFAIALAGMSVGLLVAGILILFIPRTEFGVQR